VRRPGRGSALRSIRAVPAECDLRVAILDRLREDLSNGGLRRVTCIDNRNLTTTTTESSYMLSVKFKGHRWHIALSSYEKFRVTGRNCISYIPVEPGCPEKIISLMRKVSARYDGS
jgi:hypothetical protein